VRRAATLKTLCIIAFKKRGCSDLANVPHEVEWLANLTNRKTRSSLQARRFRILILHWLD
jgi:hypothetical protein